ncbi:MAG: hypothetical protein R2911_37555 [Caldilineaceae bacterium]
MVRCGWIAPAVADAVNALGALAKAPFDIDALDVVPHANAAAGMTLHMRLGGLDDVLHERAEHLLAYLQTKVPAIAPEAGKLSLVRGDEDAALWEAAANLRGQLRTPCWPKYPSRPQSC